MQDSQSVPIHRHSLTDPIHSPTLSFEGDDLENSGRDRFSLDHHDPLNPGLVYPHIHPIPAPQPLYRRILVILSLILLWYTFSLLLSLYNKWMFAPDHLDFPFPLFVTGLHMMIQFIMSGIVLWCFPQFRPKPGEYMSTKDYTYNYQLP
jgi:hypothetical protein